MISTDNITSILSYHFTITSGHPNYRLHKNKVLDIFRLYSPNITIRTLVSVLRSHGIQYNDSLREFGDSKNKGIFIGLEIITDEKNPELQSPSAPTPQGYHGKQLSVNTAETWQSRINKLNSLGLQSALDHQDYDKIINIITSESESPNSVCTSITAVLNLLLNESTAGNNDEVLVEKLVALRKHFKEEIDSQRSQNKLSPKEQESWIDWEDVYSEFKQLTDIREKVVLGLYVYQAPRRIQDYDEMYYVKDENNTDKNYYLIDTDGYFIFNKYKTSGKYKKQKIKVTPDMQKLLNEYISKYKIQYGHRLLGDLDIRSTLYDIFGKNVGVGILRKSFLTFLHKTNPTTAVMEKVAKLMAHSVYESLRYRKILETSD